MNADKGRRDEQFEVGDVMLLLNQVPAFAASKEEEAAEQVPEAIRDCVEAKGACIHG